MESTYLGFHFILPGPHIFSEYLKLLAIGLYFGLHPFLFGFHLRFHFGHNGHQMFEIHHNCPPHGFKPDSAQFNPIPLLTAVAT
jgi:hypothetical protein